MVEKKVKINQTKKKNRLYKAYEDIWMKTIKSKQEIRKKHMKLVLLKKVKTLEFSS